MAKNEAVFFDVKCVKEKKLFHARYDFAADDRWVLTYGIRDDVFKSMSISENAEKNQKTIDLSNARTGPQYKCPYCGNNSFVRCGKCKKLTCYDDSGVFTCVSCGSSGKVSGVISNLEGSKGKAQ